MVTHRGARLQLTMSPWSDDVAIRVEQGRVRVDPTDRLLQTGSEVDAGTPVQDLPGQVRRGDESLDLAVSRTYPLRVVLDRQRSLEDLADHLDEVADRDIVARPELDRPTDRRRGRELTGRSPGRVET